MVTDWDQISRLPSRREIAKRTVHSSYESERIIGIVERLARRLSMACVRDRPLRLEEDLTDKAEWTPALDAHHTNLFMCSAIAGSPYRIQNSIAVF